MNTEIKAIETTYNGMKFRSRLEARWALFFDRMGIRWVYEHEGYETPFGRYVPDFWLPDVYIRGEGRRGAYFEVKPLSYEGTVHPALEYVCQQQNTGGILAKDFPSGADYMTDCLYEIAPWWDDSMGVYKCSHGHIVFDFSEYLYDDCAVCKTPINYENKLRDVLPDVITHRFW